MEKQSRRFLMSWVLAGTLIGSVVVGFNVAMDPYLVIGAPRIVGFNEHKPAVHGHDRLMKTYDVLREHPKTLILGSSRVELGLDAQYPAWPEHDRPVYNLGVAGGTPYIAYRYLQHVMSHNGVELAVLGLDFETFLTTKEASRAAMPDFESGLMVTRDGNINTGRTRKQIRDLVQATISLDALSDSTATLTANLTRGSIDMVAGNFVVLDRAHGGSYAFIMSQELYNARRYYGEANPMAMEDVQAIINLCKSHGTHLIFFINPVHADTLEMMSLLGYWPVYEAWKRELVTLTAKYSGADGRSRIALWDFSGYDSYSTEAVSVNHTSQWYWDPSHYSKIVGDVIVRRILGMSTPDFGVSITPENIESHLASIRQQQRIYREYRQADERRVREAYGVVIGTPAQVAATAH